MRKWQAEQGSCSKPRALGVRTAYLDVEGGSSQATVCHRWLHRAATGRAHHICDVLLLQGDGEVLSEQFGADGALTGGQGLHLVEGRGWEGRGQKLQLPAGGRRQWPGVCHNWPGN